MLAGLMENNYDRMWSFQKFFEHSSYICDLTFVSVMNLNGGDMIDLAFEKHQKYLKTLSHFHSSSIDLKIFNKNNKVE